MEMFFKNENTNSVENGDPWSDLDWKVDGRTGPALRCVSEISQDDAGQRRDTGPGGWDRLAEDDDITAWMPLVHETDHVHTVGMRRPSHGNRSSVGGGEQLGPCLVLSVSIGAKSKLPAKQWGWAPALGSDCWVQPQPNTN